MPGTALGSLRLLLDTNVVVAGLLWNGPPRRLIERAIEDETIELFSSSALLDELAHTLEYAKFAIRIRTFGTDIATLTAQYATIISLVMPTAVPRVVAGDPDDDHVIAAAVAARVELIVSGDLKHLLPIGSHQGIAIISVREAIRRIEARGLD